MIHQLFPIVLWVGGALAQNHCDTFHSVHPEETIWFQSPNFPLNYPPSTDCTYAFEAPEGFVLEFDAAEFSLEQVSPVSGICWDSLTFSELGLPPGSELRCKLKAVHCGTAGPSRIRSTIRKVQAVFHTDLTGNAKGFRISVRAIPRPADVCSDDYSLSADVGGTDTVPVTEDENNSADTLSPETVDEEPAAADTEEEPVNMIIEELSPDEVLDLEPMDEVKEEEEDAENGDSQPASATAATDEEPATTNAVTDHFTPEYLSYSATLNAEHDEVLESSDDDASPTGDEPADTSVVPAAPDSSAAAVSVGAEGPANAVPEDHSTRQPSHQWVSALNAAYGDVLDSEDASPLPEPEDTSVAEASAPDNSTLVGVVVLDSAAVLSPFSPLDVLMQRLRETLRRQHFDEVRKYFVLL
ncbi:hypothetical protein BV898_17164 [Hypsibius exemplaris]|uniref:CUB domain-containing protein n=1 Tax=Hypsibius exemplaris TaxID=2072580 RepID=A0A9X6NH74_HYPEX|nr:hypothetical protein BV898_17164 [Hypsibius exemplaris]